MFKARMKSETMKDVLSCIDIMLDDAKIDISQEGLRIKGVDPANIAMCDVNIKKSAFEDYNVTDGSIGVSINKLAGIVEGTGKDEFVSLEVDETNHKLIVKAGVPVYTVGLLDPNSIRKYPENVGYTDTLDCKLTVMSEMFVFGIKSMLMVGDYAIFKATEGYFLMRAEGEDAVDYKIDRGKVVELDGEGTALYSLDYLEDISKPAKKAELVTLLFHTDYPLTVKFTLDNKNIEVEYSLAPRVEAK